METIGRIKLIQPLTRRFVIGLTSVIYLVPLEPRPLGYDPLKVMNLEKHLVKELGESGEKCWESILKKDINGLGKAMTTTFLVVGKDFAVCSSRLGDERDAGQISSFSIREQLPQAAEEVI